MAVLFIGALAARSGLTRTTIRYYESIGVLGRSARTPAGYRMYREDALTELRFVKLGRSFGLTLDDIREILRTRRAGRTPCAQLITVSKKRLAQVDQQIAELTAFRSRLGAALAQWDCGEPVDGPCRLIDGDCCAQAPRNSDR